MFAVPPPSGGRSEWSPLGAPGRGPGLAGRGAVLPLLVCFVLPLAAEPLVAALSGAGGACRAAEELAAGYESVRQAPGDSPIELEALRPGAVLRGPRSVAVDEDASALLLNPATLLPRRGSTLRLEYVGAEEGKASGWSLLGGVGRAAAGWQRVRAADGSRSRKRFLLGSSFELYPGLRGGFSLSWNRAWGAGGRKWNGLTGGLLYRPTSWLSLGAVGENLNRPSPGGVPLERRYVFGIGLRPLTDRVTFMADAVVEEGRFSGESADYRAGVALEPIDGLLLGFSYNDPGEVFPGKPELEATVGVNLARVGLRWTGRRESSGEPEGVRDRSFSLLLSSRHQRTSFRGKRKVAALSLGGHLTDGEPRFALFADPRTGLARARRVLRKAAGDPSVGALLLRMGSLSAGYFGGVGGLAQELRDEIADARRAGLPVVSFIEGDAWGAGYYIAAAADSVVISPAGLLGGLGASIDLMRIRGAGEKVGIRWELEKVGKYKDTFYGTADEPTEEQLDLVRRIVDGLYGLLIEGVAESRGLATEDLAGISDGSLAGPRRASELGLVDRVAHQEEAVLMAARMAGLSPDDADEVELLDLSERRYREYGWGAPARVVVIEIHGSIFPGRSGHDLLSGSRATGAETVAELLRDARRDRRVKAVVLRIDSGGGDGAASEAIRREVELVRGEGKPVVVSMADVAASGGYYVGMEADRIFAHPATLTGSIGAASMKTNLEGLFEKLGLTHYVIKRGEHVDMFSSGRSWTDDERVMIQELMEDFHEEFIRRVANARRLSLEEVRELAQGQVMTGAEARARGLVDEMGGLREALDEARALAGLRGEPEVLILGAAEGGWGEAVSGVTRVMGHRWKGRK